MRSTILTIVMITVVWFAGCSGKNSEADKTAQVKAASVEQPISNSDTAVTPYEGSGEVIVLNKADFLAKVYNFEKSPDKWVFNGTKPCIIDFYADWCRPCRMVAPIMEEFAQKYAGQITIYKINTDQEKELAGYFGIRSIPSVLFCPVNGKPQMTQGALPKEEFEKIISQFLLVPSTK